MLPPPSQNYSEVGGGGGWPPGPPLPTPMQSTQHLLFFKYSLFGHSISRERERKRVNDENYLERERERDAVHPDVERDQK